MFAGVMKDPDDNDRSFEGVVNMMNHKEPTGMTVNVRHIDGKHNALHRRDKMRWLSDSETDINQCRIVSNARCLSEGVDVPALDGVVFLNPRKSVVDVVQSVGRVMRKVPGKDFGYIVLPVAIPAGIDYSKAMSDNKTFKVVWEVLNALRSHDEEFAREINKLILDKRTENTGEVTPRISISVLGRDNLDKASESVLYSEIKSRIIQKVGDIDYYDKYGQKLGEATHTIEVRLKNKIDSVASTRHEITNFHAGLKEMVNDSVTFDATIQAISQHMVLSRVFDELFAGEFTSHNPISAAFNEVVKKIGLVEELEELEEFYDEVQKEVSQIKTREARQSFIKKIYGNFFESADKKGTEQHGIVYTPVEVIDFIINSTQHILKTEFGAEFNDRSVKVLEPFAGTGTFLVRLLESGYITTNFYEKYKHDLYANELILLAYYIATVNIETTYSSLRYGNRYVPFDGISYTDTLRINAQYREGERHRQVTATLTGRFKAAHERIKQQRGAHLHVLIGNPPYSAGQKNYNDQTQNIPYPELDKRITNTYVMKTNTQNKNSLYDSYIRAIRWASDRIGDSGIVAFITNASFITSDAGSGIRVSLQEEFTDVWCFDLRGNQRTQGAVSRKEGGKIFGSGSRAPVAITILVKNPKKKTHTIHYKDIGDYLSREDKLKIIRNAKSIINVGGWREIQPDSYHDWIGQRNPNFSKYTPIGSRNISTEKTNSKIFLKYWNGLASSRDTWVYNTSKNNLSENMKQHIAYCNDQDPDNPIFDSRQAKWSPGLSDRLKRLPKQAFDDEKIRVALYRPFFKQYLYLDKVFIHRPAIAWNVFPKKDSENLIIIIPYNFSGGFSTLITNTIPDFQVVFNDQCFSLYIYENNNRKDNITDYSLHEYQNHYNNTKITKKDIFYYVYGLLHHTEYKKKFANSLSKELPRIPMAPNFEKFSKIGKELAELHLNYETCPRYSLGKPKASFGNLEKISFSKIKNNGKQSSDRTILKINRIMAFENIPNTFYRVNGRTPLEWIIDRCRFTEDKDSGITNNPCKDMTQKKTIALIERMVYVSVESDKLISELSKEEFEPKGWRPKKMGLDAHMNMDGTVQSTL